MRIITEDTKLESLIKSIKLVIFDSDGVLVEEGAPIPGAKELINHFLEEGKKLVVFSNNSTQHPRAMSEKYKRLGLNISDVVNSSLITARYCVEQEIKRVYIIGEIGLREVMEEHDIVISDQNVDAVIVGMDRQLTYQKLAIATRLIRTGAKFIGTNPDKSFPTPRGLEPGAGSMIAALIASSDQNPEIILGKPEKHGFLTILTQYNIEPENCLMIGDRYETDILGAVNVNIPALVVNTGVAKSRINPGQFGDSPAVKVIENLYDLIF